MNQGFPDLIFFASSQLGDYTVRWKWAEVLRCCFCTYVYVCSDADNINTKISVTLECNSFYKN